MSRLIVSTMLAYALIMSLNVYAKPNPVGHWHGTLNVGITKLRLWLEVSKDQRGYFQATMESIDQSPGKKIQVSDFTLEDNTITFVLNDIGAEYRGVWDDSTSSWKGSFKQGKSFNLQFKSGPPKQAEIYSALEGVWKSDIMGHPIYVTVTSDQFGTKAVLASPDDGVEALPIAAIKQEQQQVIIEIPNVAVRFQGELSQDGLSFTGKWHQKGQPRRTLTFKLQDAMPKQTIKRPQMPKGNLPYITEEVSFTNPNAKGVKLAATLSLPSAKGRFPAAILISGSGPQDRDESFMGHKPFAVLADHLTRNGIAVLRYDDRGFAKSTGNHTNATSQDFASDANAAFKFLQSHPQIESNAIGMIGHSEGGLIAPLAANTNKDIAYIIMLAGPGINTVDLMIAQQRAMANLQQLSKTDIEKMLMVTKEVMTTVKWASDSTQAQNKVLEVLTTENMAKLQAPMEQKEFIANSFLTPWYQYFIKYDPERYFQNKSMPILALYGESDIQVTGKENYAGLSILLREHKDKEIILLPKMNHLFQEAKTGAISEYRTIEETMSPKVLNKISDWLNTRF